MPKTTKVTSKYQTSIPKNIRKILGIKSGDEVEWDVVKSMVILGTRKRVENPVKFLTTQIKLNLDAVSLVRESRDEFR